LLPVLASDESSIVTGSLLVTDAGGMAVDAAALAFDDEGIR
jgi:hypothetical protein